MIKFIIKNYKLFFSLMKKNNFTLKNLLQNKNNFIKKKIINF